MFETLKYLSEIDGASGFEYMGHKQVEDLFMPYCDEITSDKNGNLICVKRSKKENAQKWMIEAHFDQIGLMVKTIEEGGFITFTSIGGIDIRTITAATVTIHGRQKLKGVIGAKPPHLSKGEEKPLKITDLAIDTGLSQEKLKTLVSVGDMITFDRKAIKLLNNNAAGRCFDDRAGILAMLEGLKRMPKEVEHDLYFVVAAQEETSSLGAMTAAYKITPDLAVIIDVEHGTAENAEKAGETFKIGDGLVLTLSGNVHPITANRISLLCKMFGIPYQTVCSPGNTGTDATAVQVVKEGIPTVALSIPLRYMHTTVETLALSDIEAVARLLVKLEEYGSGIA